MSLEFRDDARDKGKNLWARIIDNIQGYGTGWDDLWRGYEKRENRGDLKDWHMPTLRVKEKHCWDVEANSAEKWPALVGWFIVHVIYSSSHGFLKSEIEVVNNSAKTIGIIWDCPGQTRTYTGSFYTSVTSIRLVSLDCSDGTLAATLRRDKRWRDENRKQKQPFWKKLL